MIDGPGDRNWPGVLSLAAHEVRNPMTVIIGYLRMLQGGKAGPLTDRQAQFLELILKSCGSVRTVTEQLSELARLERGETQLKQAPVSLRDLIAAEISKLPDIPDREVSVQLTADDDGVIAHADAAALSAAFGSLIGRLRTELISSTELRVHLGARQENGTPTVWVAMAGDDPLDAVRDVPATALEPFEHKERSGWGLRLVIAEYVIEAHGGRLLQKIPRAARGPVAVMLPRERPSDADPAPSGQSGRTPASAAG